jgi:hypothetical protein
MRMVMVWAPWAGTLNAEQMESLFSPVPFGEPRVSVLERIAAPEHAPIWDMFRSIDPDKQAAVLLVRARAPAAPRLQYCPFQFSPHACSTDPKDPFLMLAAWMPPVLSSCLQHTCLALSGRAATQCWDGEP